MKFWIHGTCACVCMLILALPDSVCEGKTVHINGCEICVHSMTLFFTVTYACSFPSHV